MGQTRIKISGCEVILKEWYDSKMHSTTKSFHRWTGWIENNLHKGNEKKKKSQTIVAFGNTV